MPAKKPIKYFRVVYDAGANQWDCLFFMGSSKEKVMEYFKKGWWAKEVHIDEVTPHDPNYKTWRDLKGLAINADIPKKYLVEKQSQSFDKDNNDE